MKPVGDKLLTRLAPGMSASYIVTFAPTHYADYAHKITFNTDADQYVLAFIGKQVNLGLSNDDDALLAELQPRRPVST